MTQGAPALALAALVLVGAASNAAFAQRGGGLSGECRREVVKLCGLGNFRQCLSTRLPELAPECRQDIMGVARARSGAKAAPPIDAREIAFGSDPAQRLDLYPAKGARGAASAILFVHGGGWAIGDKRLSAAAKAAHFTARGMAFASTNYRLVPGGTVEQQAADVAAAVALLRKQPGIDPGRIVLLGHSAGAHLVALVGADPRYLQAAGVPMSAVRGVIPVDGAGYDVARQIASPRNFVYPMYVAAFGADPARHKMLSPSAHAAAPNVMRWLIINDADRRDAEEQSSLLAAVLTNAGATVARLPVADTSHRALNINIGKAGDAETARIDAFLVEALR